MNTTESNQGIQDPAEMEARIVAWVSGEASGSESAELERLAAARPELAAFKGRVEALRGLALEAVSPDAEPLRLSVDRRAELFGAFAAARRRNLAYAASFTVLLFAGIAWLGEITHSIPPLHAIPRDDTPPPFTIEPDPAVPVESDDTERKPKEELAPPQQPDFPSKPTINEFPVPIEPPHPYVDPKMVAIPIDTGPGGPGNHAFSLSQLDEPPVERYRARPIYPEAMRRDGISGEVTVDFIVDPSGNVRNATAVHSSLREFEESACNAVGKWKFRPGRKDGHAVFVHMQVPIVFTLSEE